MDTESYMPKSYTLAQRHIDIIEQVATEHSCGFSPALRFIIEDWHRIRQAQEEHLAKLRERIAATDGLSLLVPGPDGSFRRDDGGEEATP